MKLFQLAHLAEVNEMRQVFLCFYQHLDFPLLLLSLWVYIWLVKTTKIFQIFSKWFLSTHYKPSLDYKNVFTVLISCVLKSQTLHKAVENLLHTSLIVYLFNFCTVWFLILWIVWYFYWSGVDILIFIHLPNCTYMDYVSNHHVISVQSTPN